MCMSAIQITKPNSSVDYQVDGRATISIPLLPQSYNVADGVTNIPVSGIRVNADIQSGRQGE